ncbi:MAG: EamA family transporter [Pseudomonadota bacterium]
MKALEFGLIVFGVMLNAAAQLLLKAGTRTIGQFEFSAANVWPIGWSMATNPHIVGGLSCYVVSVIVWIMALSRVEVSIAYPMLSLGYIVNAIFAWYLFGEAITVTRVVGMGIIIIGVYLVAKPT